MRIKIGRNRYPETVKLRKSLIGVFASSTLTSEGKPPCFKYKETTRTDRTITGADFHVACLSYLCALKESKYI